MNIKTKQRLNFKRKEILIKKATDHELEIKKLLDENKIKYMFQKGFISGNGFYIADFYFPKPIKKILEIDGKYHDTDEQKQYDKRRDMYFLKRGIKTIRIKNDETKNMTIDSIVRLLTC